MRDTILHCKRYNDSGEVYDYYVARMMHYTQAAIDRKLNLPRTLNKEWQNDA
jgi:hypothetical protein